MNMRDLYQKVKMLMFEKSSSTVYDAYFEDAANLVFSEIRGENEMAFLFRGLVSPEYDHISMNGTDDLSEIFDREYLDRVIPLGIAAHLLIDDDLQKYSIFNTKYQNARIMAQKMVIEDVQ